MPVFETSAKDDSNCDHVDGIFLTIAHKLVSGKSLIKPVPDPSNPETQPVRLLYQSHIAAPPSDDDSCCFWKIFSNLHRKKIKGDLQTRTTTK